MSDDDTIEELLDDESGLDDEIFDDDDGDEDEVFEDPEDVLDDPLDDGDDEEEDDEAGPVSLDASEDGDDEIDGQPAVDLAAIEGLDVDDPRELVEEDPEDVDDTIRDGEFVCRSCHMAKRSSALADADEMLCRDCV